MSSTDYNTKNLIPQDQAPARDESQLTEMQKVRLDRGLADAGYLSENNGQIHSAEERSKALEKFLQDEENKLGWKKGTLNNDTTAIGQVNEMLGTENKQNIAASLAKGGHPKPYSPDRDGLKDETTKQVMEDWTAKNQNYLDKIGAYNKQRDNPNADTKTLYQEAERALQIEQAFLNEAKTRSDIPSAQKKVMDERLDGLEQEGKKYGFNTEGKNSNHPEKDGLILNAKNGEMRHFNGQMPGESPSDPREQNGASQQASSLKAEAAPKLDAPELRELNKQIESGKTVTAENATPKQIKEIRDFAKKFGIQGTEGEGKLTTAQIETIQEALHTKADGKLGKDTMAHMEATEKYAAPVATPAVAKTGGKSIAG